jgi:ferredoxin
MAKYKVTFLPEQKEVEVNAGTTLLQAAEQAGIRLNTLCGGEGLCGECRLQVVDGKARADKNAIGFFSKDELQAGFVLACQTRVEDDLQVNVPAKSRAGEEHIITEGTAITYSQPEKVVLHRRPHDPASFFEPLVSKIYLELPEPTSNVSHVNCGKRWGIILTRYPWPVCKIWQKNYAVTSGMLPPL